MEPREINTEHAISRVNVPALDAILGHAFPLLDHGHIRLVDYMGDDSSIVQMARVSYGAGTQTPSSDEGLIRYLMRHWHTTPFEGCEIKFHVKLPIFVARQWIRHRTANVNEYSGRYSVMRNEFYMPQPERLGRQSTTNKQGTAAEGYALGAQGILRRFIDESCDGAFDTYEKLIDEDGFNLSRELARIVLPLSTYTEFYWKIDLHNLFHFMRLRADPHAQMEIRVYADEMHKIIQKWVPLAYQAYLDYRQNAVTFSAAEMQMIRGMAATTTAMQWWPESLSERERKEFLAKVTNAG